MARSLAERDIPLGPGEPLPVPGTLRALLGLRLADLAPEIHGVTLAASALARPTVALVEASVRPVDRSAALAAAVDAGLPQEMATALTTQLLVGSAKLLAERGDPATLRAMVTSPGGTTAAGLRVLDERGLRQAFVEAVRAATQRSRELSADR